MMKKRRIAILLALLMLATMLLTACSPNNPEGSWVLTKVRNDVTGDWAALLGDIETYGGAVTAEITSADVTIELEYDGYVEELISFFYTLDGRLMVDPTDMTSVTFRRSGDTLTLIFSDCELVFTRAR